MSSTTDRIRDLIQRSGASQQQFAAAVGLDPTKLSKSLNGTRRFSSLDLARIADHTRVTVDWLLTGVQPPLALAARSTGGSVADAVQAAKRLITLRADMAFLGFRQPWKPLPQNDSGTWKAQGERLAADAAGRIREAGRSSTEHDLPDVVEAVFGADVAVVPLGQGFDGLAVGSPDGRLILLAGGGNPARQRFTLAHELGHLLADDDQELHLDPDVDANRRDPSEARANAFAAALLMPEEALVAAVQPGFGVDSFATLACDLGVSPAALAYRMEHLRLIDSGGRDRFRRLSVTGAAELAGRTDELARRVATASERRPPGLLVGDAFRAYTTGRATLRPYAELIDLDVDTIRTALETMSGDDQ